MTYARTPSWFRKGSETQSRSKGSLPPGDHSGLGAADSRARDHPTTAARTLAPRQLPLVAETNPMLPPSIRLSEPDDQNRADYEQNISYRGPKIKRGPSRKS